MRKEVCSYCGHVNRIESKLESAYCQVCSLPLSPPKTNVSLPMSTEEVPSLFSRLLARAIDYLLLTILLILVDMVSQSAFHDGMLWFVNHVRGVTQINIALSIFLLTSIGYFVIFHTVAQQTLGKRMVQISTAKLNQKPANFFAYLLRELGLLLTWVTGGWLLIILLVSSEKRGFHDLISGVKVYSVTSQHS